MDINGVANNELRSFLTESQRQQSTINSFQSVLDKAANNAGGQDEAALLEACETFESYFLQMMFREMRKTSLNENGILSQSQAEKMFTDMLDEEVSKTAAKSGGIGLAESMYRQMTLLQGNRVTE